MDDLPESRAKQFLEGYSNQASKSLNWVSFVVFIGTGILWLVSHIQNWPGGYLPWMLTLAAVLLAVSSFLNAQRFMQERDRMSAELSNYLDSTRYAIQFESLAFTDLMVSANEIDLVQPFQFILTLRNVSAYPVEFQITSADFTIGIQNSDPVSDRGGITLAGAQMSYRCGLLSGVTHNAIRLGGEGEYVIRYGHPSRGFQYVTKHKFLIQPVFSTSSFSPDRWNWISTEGPTYEDWSDTEA